jgi:uncharacterized protein (DUF302 family)
MPCRVAVYEKEDGKVYVSRLNTTNLKNSAFEEAALDIMNEAANEIESLLESIIE